MHKLLIIIFDDINLRLFFTLVSFYISLILIFLFFKDKFDKLFVIYFLVLSIFTFPFQQEYLDPLIYLLAFTFFNNKLFISYKKSYLVALFYLVLLVASKNYYNITIT